MGKYRRRNYFIKKGFQGRFVMKFLFLSSLGILFSVGLFNLLAYRKMDAILYSMTLPATGTRFIFLREALLSNIAAVLFVVVLFAIVSREVFRNIRDPLSVIRLKIRHLTNGHLSGRVSLRKDDEFTEFAEDLNAMAEKLSGKFTGIKKSVSLLSDSVEELKQVPESSARAVLREKIMDQVASLDEQIKAFRK